MASRRKVARYTSAQLQEAALVQATDAQYIKLLELISKGWRITQTDFLHGCDSIIWIRSGGNVPMRRAVRPDGTLFHVSPGFKSLPYPTTYTPRVRK
jgi:hypothetical protein